MTSLKVCVQKKTKYGANCTAGMFTISFEKENGNNPCKLFPPCTDKTKKELHSNDNDVLLSATNRFLIAFTK